MRATRRVAVPDESQATIRNELARIASEFRWRGLTVNVTGVTTGVYLFDPRGGEALLAALRATFEKRTCCGTPGRRPPTSSSCTATPR
jgi:hypothetical protein